MILSKRADVERFLAHPPPEIRACLLFGKDRGGVKERADQIASKTVADPTDPFDVSLLTEVDLDRDATRLIDDLSALSLMRGRRLIRLKLGGDKSGPEKQAAEALKAHVDGATNPDAFFLIEGLRKRRSYASVFPSTRMRSGMSRGLSGRRLRPIESG